MKFKNGGTKATITLNVPGPGTVSATQVNGAASARVSRASASVASRAGGKKKKKPLISPATVHVAAAGTVKLTVKLTGPAVKLLAKKRKLTVPVNVTFTPTGGSPASHVLKLTFKKHGKHKKHG